MISTHFDLKYKSCTNCIQMHHQQATQTRLATQCVTEQQAFASVNVFQPLLNDNDDEFMVTTMNTDTPSSGSIGLVKTPKQAILETTGLEEQCQLQIDSDQLQQSSQSMQVSIDVMDLDHH